MSHATTARPSFAAPLFVFSALAAAAAILIVLLPVPAGGYFGENGPVEAVQGLVLLLAAITFGIAAGSAPGRPLAAFLASLALVCLSMMLRELDFTRSLGLEWIALLLHGPVAAAVIIMAWGALAFWARRDVWATARVAAAWLLSLPGWLMIAGALLYAAGWPFDRGIFPLERKISLAVEETLELLATLLIAVAAGMTMLACAVVNIIAGAMQK